MPKGCQRVSRRFTLYIYDRAVGRIYEPKHFSCTHLLCARCEPHVRRQYPDNDTDSHGTQFNSANSVYETPHICTERTTRLRSYKFFFFFQKLSKAQHHYQLCICGSCSCSCSCISNVIKYILRALCAGACGCLADEFEWMGNVMRYTIYILRMKCRNETHHAQARE